MGSRLWDRGGAPAGDRDLQAQVEAFTVGDDPEVDLQILADDCWASIAHAAALTRARVLTVDELRDLQRELLALLQRHARAGVPIQRSQEDCHTAIEQELTARLGDLGKKIHTGRSRNDQVLTALRLHARRRLMEVGQALAALARTLLERARQGARVPMRGYSHAQPAMPTTLAVFLGAHAEALLDDARLLRAAFDLNDQSPLGSAAGFGSVIPLDRAYSAGLLGFSRVQVNALYCQNSRGKVEGAILHALSSVQDSLARLAADLILFTTREFGFVRLPDELTTGSSIMPQKRNPDVLELVRARAGVVAGAAEQVRRVAAALPSGYNRDYQLLKGPLLAGFSVVSESLAIMDRVVASMELDERALAASCTREIYAADVALEKAMGGVPFREAYGQALAELEQVQIDDDFVARRIDAYRTLGSMGDPGLELLAENLEQLEGWLAERQELQRRVQDALSGPLVPPPG